MLLGHKVEPRWPLEGQVCLPVRQCAYMWEQKLETPKVVFLGERSRDGRLLPTTIDTKSTRCTCPSMVFSKHCQFHEPFPLLTQTLARSKKRKRSVSRTSTPVCVSSTSNPTAWKFCTEPGCLEETFEDEERCEVHYVNRMEIEEHVEESCPRVGTNGCQRFSCSKPPLPGQSYCGACHARPSPCVSGMNHSRPKWCRSWFRSTLECRHCVRHR